MRRSALHATRYTALLVSLLCISSFEAQAQGLIFQPQIEKFLELLYDRVADGRLDTKPFYEAAGISVSDNTCDPAAGTVGSKACATIPCPSQKALGLSIVCFYNKRIGANDSDLLIKPPYPVKKLGDYSPDWNTYQHKILETKLGGRLPQVGLVRTLSVPDQQRTGFFELRPIEEASNAEMTLMQWRIQAKKLPIPTCGVSLCFSVHQIKFSAEMGQSAITEAIFECISKKIREVSGAPEYCVPIYLSGRRGSFISMLTSFRSESMKVSRGIISASVFFEQNSSARNFQVIVNLIEKALTATPLSLETGQDSDAVVGVANMRPSQVLMNWYETTTVRAILTGMPLSFNTPGEEGRSIFGIKVGLATTLFVNNRNTTEESEWRMPTSAQSSSYDTSIIKSIKEQASRECADALFQVRDSVNIITCPSGKW